MTRPCRKTIGNGNNNQGYSSQIDWASALKELAKPFSPGEKIKIVIERAARRCGLSYWRAFDIWYGKARRIESSEAEKIQQALDRHDREAAHRELHELRIRVARLEALLSSTDEEFHSEQLTALGRALRMAR